MRLQAGIELGENGSIFPRAEAALAPTRKRLAELRMAVAGYDRRRFRPLGKTAWRGGFLSAPAFFVFQQREELR